MMNPFMSFVIFVVQAVTLIQTWPFRITALRGRGRDRLSRN